MIGVESYYWPCVLADQLHFLDGAACYRLFAAKCVDGHTSRCNFCAGVITTRDVSVSFARQSIFARWMSIPLLSMETLEASCTVLIESILLQAAMLSSQLYGQAGLAGLMRNSMSSPLTQAVVSSPS